MPWMIKDLVNSFRQDPETIYHRFIHTLSEEFTTKPLQIFENVCFGPSKSSSASADSSQHRKSWRRVMLRRYLDGLAMVNRKRTSLSKLTCSCLDCSQKCDEAWNTLPVHWPRPSAQDPQAATQEVSACVICFDGPRNFLCVPCGHRGCCE